MTPREEIRGGQALVTRIKDKHRSQRSSWPSNTPSVSPVRGDGDHWTNEEDEALARRLKEQAEKDRLAQEAQEEKDRPAPQPSPR